MYARAFSVGAHLRVSHGMEYDERVERLKEWGLWVEGGKPELDFRSSEKKAKDDEKG